MELSEPSVAEGIPEAGPSGEIYADQDSDQQDKVRGPVHLTVQVAHESSPSSKEIVPPSLYRWGS